MYPFNLPWCDESFADRSMIHTHFNISNNRSERAQASIPNRLSSPISIASCNPSRKPDLEIFSFLHYPDVQFWIPVCILPIAVNRVLLWSPFAFIAMRYWAYHNKHIVGIISISLYCILHILNTQPVFAYPKTFCYPEQLFFPTPWITENQYLS